MKPIYILLMMVIGSIGSADAQGLPNYFEYKQYVNGLLNSSIPEEVEEGVFVNQFFKESISTFFINMDGTTHQMEGIAQRIIARGNKTNNIPNFAAGLAEVQMVIVNVKNFGESTFKISQDVMAVLPNLRYVVLVGEFNYTSDFKNIMPVNPGNVIFLHLKSIPS